MVYNVLAVHSWKVRLGVVEYLTDGELVSELVKRSIERFPKMKFDLPPRELDEMELFTIIHNTMTSYLKDFRLSVTRAELSRVTEFLKVIDGEYRRWKFDSSMETGAPTEMMEELIPLIKLYKANSAQGNDAMRTLLDYAVEELATFFSGAVVEEFSDAVVMFQTMHRGKLSGLKLTLDFPQCQYYLMDMRLLIEVSEE